MHLNTCIFYLLQDIEQPLWWKSLAIQLSQPERSPIRRLILRLGAFHMEMSFLGSIGHLMAGSGIKELFEMIYALKAVEQIKSGKAISRAVRAHLLLDTVLNGLLLSKSMELSTTTPNHQTRHRVPTQSWKLPSRTMTSWWPWQRTPWRMMKPLQGSKPSATATWKHWRMTQRPVCGYNTSIWYGFSVSSSEPNGWATDISILKLYRRWFRTWPLLATRCMQSPPAFIQVELWPEAEEWPNSSVSRAMPAFPEVNRAMQ